MKVPELESAARALVPEGKGILAADESFPTIKKRFDSVNVESTEETRRSYRELLFTTPGIEEYISGVILFDETIQQKAYDGRPFASVLDEKGIVSGIKVDTGTTGLAGFPGERVTEGLDGLRDRLYEYIALGARFAKWRAVFVIGDGIPTRSCIEANAHLLGRYASLCQEAGLVPIVEPEVLMDGGHEINRCSEVTEATLKSVFSQLHEYGVMLEGMLLKPNMVLPGKGSPKKATPARGGAKHHPLSQSSCSCGGARHRLSLRWPEPRGGYPTPERHECHGQPSMGAELLLRAGVAGAGAQGMAG